MSKYNPKAAMLFYLGAAIFVAGVFYLTTLRHDSLSFTNADRFTIADQKDLNISIPNGSSMRSDYVTYSHIFGGNKDVYGWYFTKSPCSESVKIPDPDKDKNEMNNFITHIADMFGGEHRIDGLGICIEKTNSGAIQAYADKKTREVVSLDETVNLIKMGIDFKMRRDHYTQEQVLAEKQQKESWGKQ